MFVLPSCMLYGRDIIFKSSHKPVHMCFHGLSDVYGLFGDAWRNVCIEHGEGCLR